MSVGLKSFVKVMDLVAAGTSSIEFRDSAGSAIPCNYFSVQVRNVSGATFPEHGYYFVAPSAGIIGAAGNGAGELYISSTTMYNTAIAASATQGSWLSTTKQAPGAGGVAGTADATVEMSFVPPDRCIGLTIYNSLGSKGRFVITYGNLEEIQDWQVTGDRKLYPRGN